METNINPYASPQQPEEDPPIDTARVLQARFFVDERGQRESARQLRPRQRTWLLASITPALLLLFILWLVRIWNEPWLIDYGALVLHLFLLSAASSIAVYWFLKRRFIRRNLLHQNQHPIVGQQGKWQLTIDATNLTLQTAAGQQQWPLAEVTYHEFERRPIALFLEDDLAFALPPLGDYVDDTYHSFVSAMKLRVSTKQIQQS